MEEASHKTTSNVRSPLYEVSKSSNSEIEVEWQVPGAEEGARGELSNGNRVSVQQDEKILEIYVTTA